MAKCDNLVRNAILDAETDMRKVYDLSLILHDKMVDRGSITDEMQAALCWITADLLQIGVNLQKHFDTIDEASKGE